MTQAFKKKGHRATVAKPRLADQVTRLPLANALQVVLLGVAITVGMAFGFRGLLGGLVFGLALVAGLNPELTKREGHWKAVLAALASKLDQTAGGDDARDDEAVLALFPMHYLGGHPAWTTRASQYGQFELSAKQVVFKSPSNRIKLPFVRTRKVTVESRKQLIGRKLSDVVVPPLPRPKNALQRAVAFVQDKMRYVVVDYQDDAGEKRIVVFRPPAGNPLRAKQAKEALDAALSAYRKSKAGREEAAEGAVRVASAAMTGVFKTGDLAAAGVAGARAATGPVVASAASPASGVRRTVGRVEAANPENRFAVVVQNAGATPEEKQQVAGALVAHFGLPPGKAWAVVEQAPVVAKRQLSYQDAEQLASDLISLGAYATIETV